MLIEINERGSFSHIVLRSVLDKYQYLSKQDRAFMTRLVDGTIESFLQISGKEPGNITKHLNYFKGTKILGTLWSCFSYTDLCRYVSDERRDRIRLEQS